MSEFGAYSVKKYTAPEEEYRVVVDSPWGTAYARVEGTTLYINLPDGQVYVVELWYWWPLVLSVIAWIVYWVLWWWASGKLDYNIITRIIGLLFPGLATIGEAIIRK